MGTWNMIMTIRNGENGFKGNLKEDSLDISCPPCDCYFVYNGSRFGFSAWRFQKRIIVPVEPGVI